MCGLSLIFGSIFHYYYIVRGKHTIVAVFGNKEDVWFCEARAFEQQECPTTERVAGHWIKSWLPGIDPRHNHSLKWGTRVVPEYRIECHTSYATQAAILS
jgi:hypothetical protein